MTSPKICHILLKPSSSPTLRCSPAPGYVCTRANRRNANIAYEVTELLSTMKLVRKYALTQSDLE